jgi:ribosomal protein S16
VAFKKSLPCFSLNCKIDRRIIKWLFKGAQMEKRIKAIIEEDLKAQEAYKLAQDKINDVLMNIHKEKTNIQDQVWNKVKEQVDAERVRLTTQLEKAQADSVQQYQTALKILEDNFKVHEETWHTTLLARCLKKDV